MSLALARAISQASRKKRTREETLALIPPLVFDDGLTKQAFKDETNIVKIMARADKGATISHLEKFEGVYADYSDFDFHEQTTKLTAGREIFDELPAEVRKEFGQSPQEFFNFVNDPANKDDLLEKLPFLAQPGQQLLDVEAPNADKEAAQAASEAKPSVSQSKTAETAATPTPGDTAE